MKSFIKTIYSGILLVSLLFLGNAYAQFDQIYEIVGNSVKDFTIINKHVIQVGEGYLVAGTLADTLSGSNIFVMHVDMAGSVVWLHKYGRITEYAESASAIEKSSDGSSVYVLGEVEGPMNIGQTLVMNIEVATGTILWTRRYQRSPNDDARIISRHQGPAGQDFLVVAGTRELNTMLGPVKKVYAMAIQGNNGDVLWKQLYHQLPLSQARNYHMEVTGYTKRESELALCGRIFDEVCEDEEGVLGNRNVFVFRINPLNGSVLGNINLYDLQLDPSDLAIGSVYPLDWDITSVYKHHPQLEAPVFSGFALTGTYVHNDSCSQVFLTNVAAFRTDTVGSPVWANIYRLPEHRNGFGRSIYQNRGNTNFLSILTHHQPMNGPSPRTGFLNVQVTNGNAANFRQNQTAFKAISMRRSRPSTGANGYIALAQREKRFELIGLNEAGGGEGALCMEEIDIITVPIDIRHKKEEFVCRRIREYAKNYEMPKEELSEISVDCEEIAGAANIVEEEVSELRKGISSEESIRAYPNPQTATNQLLTIEIQSTQAKDIQLVAFNQLGQRIYLNTARLQTGQNRIEIPTSTFQPGFFFLQIIHRGKVIHQEKMIKK